MPRYENGCIKFQELILRIVEDVANGVMAMEAEQMREAISNDRNGYRGRRLETCAELSLRAPKPRSGGFFPEDVIERCQRVDLACVSSRGFEQKEHRKLGSLSTSEARTLFERLALTHEGMADAVGLATELDKPPVVDDAVDHGGVPVRKALLELGGVILAQQIRLPNAEGPYRRGRILPVQL